MSVAPETHGFRRRDFLRLMPWALGVTFFIVAWLLVPPWVTSWWTGLRGESRRTISVGFLEGCLIAYGVTLTLGLVAGSFSAARLIRGRRHGRSCPTAARILLTSIASLLSLAALELGGWGLEMWMMRPPTPPVVPPKLAAERSGANDLTMLVVGESSAEGQPFEPWFSIGHVIAWQIEKANPGTKVQVIMAARGGLALAHSLQALGSQTVRPDIVLLCSGHNEFQARWGWSRVVNYYVDDQAERPRQGLADQFGDLTPFTRLIRIAADRQAIDAPPTHKEARIVVDRPVCEPETRQGLARTFASQLGMLLDWCERAGAQPILVIPAGNDVGFDPDRSVLDSNTRAERRAKFEREFLAARALPLNSPERAIAAYRNLIAQQPLFAEAHYRLAQLMTDPVAAQREFALARDLDGLPMRCPSEFQDVYRAASAKSPGLILVDSPERLTEFSPTGLLDDSLFHDGQHPTFRAYLALAQNAMDQLCERKLFGLDRPASVRVDPDECARYFDLDRADRWVLVCRRAASFWERLAPARYDRTERNTRAERLNRAADAIERGMKPEEVGVPGLGVHPKGFD